jgi:thiol-disulfide isomerase/thioredoxin
MRIRLTTAISILGLLFVLMFVNASMTNKKEISKGLKKGQLAPELELSTLDGKIVKLSSLRGSIVFIDFWASWCKGCRQISKSLRYLNDNYKDQEFVNGKGFYVYSVCLDTDRQRWLDVIEQDSLQSFINVSDLKGYYSQVAKDYGLIGLPFGYIIDGNGIVLGDLGELRPILKKICISKQDK